jgi:hypothetical protein
LRHDGEAAGNPFEVPLEATFTHRPSMARLTLPGYYAGNSIFRIAFMPDRAGAWDYRTSSPVGALHGRSGSLLCVPSGHPGPLRGDPRFPRKWKHADGPHVVPLGLRLDLFRDAGSDGEVEAAARFLADQAGGQMFESPINRAADVFEGDWRRHRFATGAWERFERRLEILTDQEVGFHLMLYADDADAPPWEGRSQTEDLFIRYLVARLAAFPILWFNYGIDSAEYRSQEDLDWFGGRVRALDPYDHPVSSRQDEGSSDRHRLASRTFESRGEEIARYGTLRRLFETSPGLPVSMDDGWGENRPSHPDKNYAPADLRRALWKCVAAGGVGAVVRGSQSGDGGAFTLRGLREDLESEQWLGLVNRFVTGRLGGHFARMVPRPDLARRGYCLADPGLERILVFAPGRHDRWDRGDGRHVSLRLLGGAAGAWRAAWFDPRTGDEHPRPEIRGGAVRRLAVPGDDDWVLLLERSEPARR